MVGAQSETMEGAGCGRSSRGARKGYASYEHSLCAEAISPRTACLHCGGIQDEQQSLEILPVAFWPRAAEFRRVDPYSAAARYPAEAYSRVDRAAGGR